MYTVAALAGGQRPRGGRDGLSRSYDVYVAVHTLRMRDDEPKFWVKRPANGSGTLHPLGAGWARRRDVRLTSTEKIKKSVIRVYATTSDSGPGPTRSIEHAVTRYLSIAILLLVTLPILA